MAEISVQAKKREKTTKGALNTLRKEGFIPGVFYIKGEEPVSFYAPAGAINPLVFTSEAHLVNLEIEGEESKKCVIKDIQFDPITDKVVHVDFQGITVGQTLQIEVPVVLAGSAKGVKNGGILQHGLHKLDVECLPRHIPEHIEINIDNLDVNESIHVRDVSVENLRILNHEDTLIAAVVLPKAATEEGEEGEELEEENEPEVISKGKEDKEES